MIAAVTMVKDEADIIVPVISQLFAQGVDRIWVADNMSSDKTRPLLEDLAVHHPLTIVDDDEPGYYQSHKMSALAETAYMADADWVLPFDADEWWYGIGGRTIAEQLTDADADIIKTWGYDHIPQRTDDHDETDPIRRMGWRRGHTQTWPKVVFRAHPGAYLHMGNHDVEHPGRRAAGHLEYRHFGYRTLDQMARKVRQGKAAYDASTVHELHGTHWRRMGAMSDDELAGEWEALLDEQGLVHDPAP
jgi:hypothetical protein